MAYRDRRVSNTVDPASVINILAGLWLIASPWIYGRFSAGDAGVWNSIVVGVLVALFAAARAAQGIDATGLSWVNVILGAWMIASPWIYGYASDTARTANAVIVGAIILVLALSATSGREAADYSSGPWGYGYPPYYGYGWGPYGYYGGVEAPPQGARPYFGEYRGRGPRGYRRSDEQIKNEICDRMSDNPELDASDIDVKVVSAEVTLEGAVTSRRAKRLAEDLADSVAGVRDVHNQLRLPPGVQEAPRRVA